MEGWNITKNIIKSFKYLKSAADLNNPIALCKIGVCFDKCQGVDQNYSKALECFKKA